MVRQVCVEPTVVYSLTGDVWPLSFAYPQPLHCGCLSHQYSCETLLTNVQSIYNFIEGSAKLHAVFESLQERSSDFSTTLKSLSDTRWSCRAEALRAILDNFETIVDTLSEISENYVSVGGQAGSLLTSVTNFHYFFPCILMWQIQCNVLSKVLQSSTFHYASVKSLPSSTISALLAMRTDHYFQQLWKFTVELCNKNNYPGLQRPWKRTTKATVPGLNSASAQDYLKELHFAVLNNTFN